MNLNSLIINDTPLEYVEGVDCWVKREDLSSRPPLPPFSKNRGVVKHLLNLQKDGIKVVGYVETSISMAGIAVSVIAHEIGMKAVIFDPQYKKDNEILPIHRIHWKKWGAEIIPIPAGRAKVNFYKCRKILEDYQHSVMLPLGLPLEETIEETAKEFEIMEETFKNVVVTVGSGTICSGLLRAMTMGRLVGIMCRTGNVIKKRNSIIGKANKLLLGGRVTFQLLDPGWEYTESVDVETKFPCNEYYDKKAWKWLVKNIEGLDRPVLFWNIGASSLDLK